MLYFSKDDNRDNIELQASKDSSTKLETTVWIVELKPVKNFHKKSNVKDNENGNLEYINRFA